MARTVAIRLRSSYRISDHHIQETTGVGHRTESAYYIDFHSAQGKDKKNETGGKNNTKLLAERNRKSLKQTCRDKNQTPRQKSS